MILDWVFIFICIAGAAFFSALFFACRNGSLPVNSSVGLRTKAIMQSPDVWKATHKKSAPFMLIDALILCGLGAIHWMESIGHLLETSTAGYLMYLLIFFFADSLVMMALYSNRFAKDFARKQAPPTKGHE